MLGPAPGENAYMGDKRHQDPQKDGDDASEAEIEKAGPIGNIPVADHYKQCVKVWGLETTGQGSDSQSLQNGIIRHIKSTYRWMDAYDGSSRQDFPLTNCISNNAELAGIFRTKVGCSGYRDSWDQEAHGDNEAQLTCLHKSQSEEASYDCAHSTLHA